MKLHESIYEARINKLVEASDTPYIVCNNRTHAETLFVVQSFR